MEVEVTAEPNVPLTSAENQYEAERLERIRQNKEKMQQLGLLNARDALIRTSKTYGQPQDSWKPRAPKRPKSAKTKVERGRALPTRASRRLVGEEALNEEVTVEIAKAEMEEEDAAQGRSRKGDRKQLTLNSNTIYSAPFSLKSIGVTVWELGHIHRGAWAEKYWSTSGCLYHNAYPVGYRAWKEQFGRVYEMRIEEGPTGPIFKLIEGTKGQDGSITWGHIFTGPSPTKPWTDACLKHRPKQRISGPLFFGFSDIITQKAIATSLYNPQELEAALSGESLQAKTLTPEEQAAAAFNRIKGVGPAVGQALALTTEFGGMKHSGPESLRLWVVSGNREDNAAKLMHYLLHSEEIPGRTRRWPAWAHKFVPMIVATLSSDGELKLEEQPQGDLENQEQDEEHIKEKTKEDSS